jgi:protein-tyrosine phosphatase
VILEPSATAVAVPSSPAAVTALPTITTAVTIDKVVNFRDATTTGDTVLSKAASTSVIDLREGVLWRSGKLSKASSADRAVLTNLLAGGIVIDLRTKSVAKKSPDPKLAGVTRVAIPLNAGSYSKFVSDKTRRKAIAKAINTIAGAPGTVLLHCTYGRDRTGWTVAMIYYALGLPDDIVKAEYLKSSGATSAKLAKGLNEARKRYGSVQDYLTDGLKLTDETVAALRTKLVA